MGKFIKIWYCVIRMQSTHKGYISLAVTAPYLGLVVWGFLLLKSSQGTGQLLSPWQTITGGFIYVFLGATFILGGIVSFAKLKTRWLLLLLVIHGLLMYSYLPLTHPLLYGADGWRHLADINRLLEGNPWTQVATSNSSFLSTVGLVAYSGFWGVIVLISKITHFELLSILRWMQPVLTAIVLPFISFWLARSVGLTRRLSLLASWYMFLPFSLQAMGAFTLPVNLWFLLFGGAFVVLIREYNRELPRRKIVLGIFIVLCFGYSLYPILFLLAWVLAEVIRWQNSRQISPFFGIVLACMLGLVIPAVERLQRGSRFVGFSEIFSGLQQLIGNLSGWYMATGPRTHDIHTGNIFFNQAPLYAFVPNFLTEWRGWIVLFMVLFLTVALVGAYRLYRYGNQAPQQLALFSVAITISYILGRYFVSGGQILTRRMDAVIAFTFIFLVLACKEGAIEKIENRGKSIVPFVIVLILINSCVIAASYSLGPDAKIIAIEQYKAMQQIVASENARDSHCVIADTYSLLILEALSSKRIVGGGFPINADFSQPELDIVRGNLEKNGSDSYKDISYALSMTGAKRCWYVGDNGFARIIGSVEN